MKGNAGHVTTEHVKLMLMLTDVFSMLFSMLSRRLVTLEYHFEKHPCSGNVVFMRAV